MSGDDLRQRVQRNIERFGIPVGTDDPTLLALGASPLSITLPECSETLGFVEFFECITQSHDEPSPQAYLDVCTVEAELLACSFRCPDECGGHPICRPCFDLAHERGELHPKDAP